MFDITSVHFATQRIILRQIKKKTRQLNKKTVRHFDEMTQEKHWNETAVNTN